MNIKQFLFALGGASEVARALGINRSTVAMWGINGNVPNEYRVDVVRLAAESGVELPECLRDCPVCGKVIVLGPERFRKALREAIDASLPSDIEDGG